MRLIKFTYKDVKRTCVEGRFFSYNDWRDKLFVPPSFFLVWIFVSLNWTGNAVSWLSGAVTVLGGVFLASNNNTLILIGSFLYAMFYLLDYVDGGVARFRNESGIEGQYTDWIMHVVSSVSITTGIFLGALNHTGEFWIVPFGILFILASILQSERFSLGWWSICMYRQQNKCKEDMTLDNKVTLIKTEAQLANRTVLRRTIQIISTILFHENYAIFVLPILAILNILLNKHIPDFRLVLTIIGGTIYFLFVVKEIVAISKNKKLESAYNKLFYSCEKPNLPEEHFF